MDEHSHVVTGSPYERMRAVLARHLCGWIGGHAAPEGHFLPDAEAILREAHEAGIRFHLASATENPLDGFVHVSTGVS